MVPTASFSNINSMNMADAALAYAALGVEVFPLQPNSKLPMPGWSWRRMSSKDPEPVSSWWQQWPQANIGLVMGEGSGVDALDIDVKNGQDGLRSYKALTLEGIPGPVQATPTGGQHFLFTHEPGFINFTHRGEFGGLDMRTTGGYIVGAPSTTAEGNYSWIQDGPTAYMDPPLRTTCHQWSAQSNTQVVDAPEIPENLPDYHALNLQQKYLDYLDQGNSGAWDFDESRAVFACAGALQNRLQDAGLVFGIISANPFAWATAQRHRTFGNVADWLWKYGVSNIIERATVKDAREVFSPIITSPAAPEPAAEVQTFFTSGADSRARAQSAPQWLIRGLIEKGQVGLLYGDSQALKSYLLLDMAVSVTGVTGHEWHGHKVANPGAVWFLAGEGNQILWRRLEALRQTRSIHGDRLKDLWLSNSGLNLMNPQHLQYLKDQVSVAGGVPPQLLIIDTMSSNAIFDENNARDCAQLMSIGQAISSQWGTTVIFAAHTGKGNKQSVRGSSVLQANTDFRFRLERVPGQRIITQLFVEKLKGAPEPREPLTFEATPHVIVGVLDEELVPVTDLVLELAQGDAVEDLETARATARLTQKQSEMFGAIKTLITGHWTIDKPGIGVLREELLDEYRKANPGAHGSHFNKSLDRLVNRGLLEIRTEGEHSVIFLKGGNTKTD